MPATTLQLIPDSPSNVGPGPQPIFSDPSAFRPLQISKTEIVFDCISILAAAALAGFAAEQKTWVSGGWEVLRAVAQHQARSGTWAVLIGLMICIIMTGRHFHLYTSRRLHGLLHEQRLTIQAGVFSALLITGVLYLAQAVTISRQLLLVTFSLSICFLCLRRLVHRTVMQAQFERGVGNRHALIVGDGPEAEAFAQHLRAQRRLGYTLKGLVRHPSAISSDPQSNGLDELFEEARKHFVDEIIFTGRCDSHFLRAALERARSTGIDVRVLPETYGGLTCSSHVEYFDRFLTIQLHRGTIPELALILKRVLDLAVATAALLLLAPVMIAIAIAIKLDSQGPVFYHSERVGKRGRLFRCIKFRTMTPNAEQRRTEVMHMNERDSILFKIANDPRITRVGRILRKYSLDEIPQFFNVIRGEMSVVGPRPPIASEVRQYALGHLRRLDVTPGITGLWQVQSRQDPSFDSYISLDFSYIENWSVWLDLRIILRTVAVVFAGTGA
jgi:exopolysaccharide biosynthesis polyprenyl glycosylphosphotransferase